MNEPEETLHPQARITHGDYTAEVDEGIAELILELWKADIPTMMSCQDNRPHDEPGPGRVWIMFPFAESAERFLNLVATFDTDTDSIYNAIAHDDVPDDWETFRAERAWTFETSPRDFGVEHPDYLSDEPVTETGPRDFVFAISIRFPHRDYPIVLARMKAHNGG
jgi:hypothetical protein